VLVVRVVHVGDSVFVACDDRTVVVFAVIGRSGGVRLYSSVFRSINRSIYVEHTTRVCRCAAERRTERPIGNATPTTTAAKAV
jgi:hypothetical protein